MIDGDSEGLLLRTRRSAAKPDFDPIEQQREALFGDNSKPFHGTLEELSRTKHRQKQRARELLFGEEPELSLDVDSTADSFEVEDPGEPRTWIGFENWDADHESELVFTQAQDEDAGDDDQPAAHSEEPAADSGDSFVAATFETVELADAESGAQEKSTIVEAHRLISIDEIEEFINARNTIHRPGGIEVEPLVSTQVHDAQFELTPLGAHKNIDDRRIDDGATEQEALTHRWTLDELWSFALKLDRVEQRLSILSPAPLPCKQGEHKSGNAHEGAHTVTSPFHQEDVHLPEFEPFVAKPDTSEPIAGDMSGLPGIPDSKPKPQFEAFHAELQTETPPFEADTDDKLPKGRTVEETYQAAMKAVEKDSIAPKERKGWLSKIIFALIIAGVIALIGLGVYQATSAPSTPAGIFEEPEFMRD